MASITSSFPVSKLDDICARPEDFRLLERVPFTTTAQQWPHQLSSPVGDEKPMVILDLETTGFDARQESIIELGMVRVLYSPSAARITSIKNVISLYEEPPKPIPDLITDLTGISNEMVRSKRIDDNEVRQYLAGDPLVVAHNATFDRPFFEARIKGLDTLSWACSLSGIDWGALGFESHKLEHLLLRLGWFYEGHRASIDCLAVAWLLHRQYEALEHLIRGASQKTVIVRAFGAPFAVKDALKSRGYRWYDNGNMDKHWWAEVSQEDLEAEQVWLNGLYTNGAQRARYDERDSRSRFKGES